MEGLYPHQIDRKLSPCPAKIIKTWSRSVGFPLLIEQGASRSLLAFVLSCGVTLALDGQEAGDLTRRPK